MEGYKVIITGASGMVGRGVLLEALASDTISKVLVLTRRSLGMKHVKLEECIVPDFNDLTSIESSLTGYDACFFCIGVSAMGMGELQYTQLTYDLTIHFAETYLSNNPLNPSQFFYVSGAGTDSSEQGRMMWARIKGRTENKLLSMPFKSAYMFRPGFIMPMKGIQSGTKLYSYLYTIFRPVYSILKHFPSTATNTTNVGLAMIHIIEKGSDKKVLDNAAINLMAQKA